MDQPAWLAAAWAEFGVSEGTGAADAPAVVRYFREAGHGEIAHDSTPWCAAFVGAMLKRAGKAATGSLLARSYLAWGDAIYAPRVGAIAVLSRGDDVGAGHVGFIVGEAGTRVFLLGGNQSDAVTVGAFDQGCVLGYRWPVETDRAEPAPPRQAPEGSTFARALKHVLQMEGGFSDDPYDPGGPTNKGITLADFAKWRGVSVDATSRAHLVAELKAISDDVVSDIYQKRYWQPSSSGLLTDAVAVMHFDASVNHGVGGAIRMLQAALGVDVDGDIGPLTLSTARAQSARLIVERYADIRRDRYRALPTFWRFGRGWLRRVDATEALAKSLLPSEPNPIETAKGTRTMDETFKYPLPGEVPGQPMAGREANSSAGKWWPQSKTVWGTLITAMATVLPIVGPLLGISIPSEVIKQLGDQAIVVIQAAGGLIGTLLALYGRAKATAPLVRQDVRVRM